MQNNINSSLFIGQNLIKLASVDSTNKFLSELFSNTKPLPEGTVILAEEQLSGKGQQGNKWLSEPGKNLTFSLLLYPAFLTAQQQFLLNKAICLGMVDALQNILPDKVYIKWPNDIYYSDRKLAGLLVENTLAGNFIKTAIIGWGLNVNQLKFGTEAARAISLAGITGREHLLEVIFASICKCIEARYLQLKAGKKDKLDEDYLQLLYRKDEEHPYRTNAGVENGIIRGVNEQGYLLLEINTDIRVLDLKEVSFIF